MLIIIMSAEILHVDKSMRENYTIIIILENYKIISRKVRKLQDNHHIGQKTAQ